MKLKNKTALVTGASTGIGRAIAVEFAKEGVFVYLVARNKKGLEQTRELIEKNKGKAEIITCDLSDIDSINDLLKSVKKKSDRINIIANVAAIWHGKDEVYADKDYQDFNQKTIIDTFMVGAVAPALLVHGLLPIMKKNSKVVNISGTFENGAKGWLPYFVSKRAIEDLTVGLAEELKEKGVQVNCISPSDTATEAYAKFFPEYMDEAVSPKMIAKEALDLCRPENRTTGEVFVIRKGEKIKKGFHE